MLKVETIIRSTHHPGLIMRGTCEFSQDVDSSSFEDLVEDLPLCCPHERVEASCPTEAAEEEQWERGDVVEDEERDEVFRDEVDPAEGEGEDERDELEEERERDDEAICRVRADSNQRQVQVSKASWDHRLTILEVLDRCGRADLGEDEAREKDRRAEFDDILQYAMRDSDGQSRLDRTRYVLTAARMRKC